MLAPSARVAALLTGMALVGCGGAAARPMRTPSQTVATAASVAGPAAARPRAAALSRVPTYPVLQSLGSPGSVWRSVVAIGGRTAAWISQRGGVTLLRFDQRLTRLALHAGSQDPGPGPWRYGDAITGGERRRLVAAFNGGFRLNSHSGGWQSDGQTVVPLTDGLASIVTYRDGTTDVGAWNREVPANRPIASVRQNLHLLVDRGVAAANLVSCLKACWGATLGGRASVARAGLGINSRGKLIWAGASAATPAGLARAMIAGGAVRAAELDINPAWVAGYLYHHGNGPIRAVPVVPGQFGVPGQFLRPYSRDYFSVFRR
jgi:hypothetical protein